MKSYLSICSLLLIGALNSWSATAIHSGLTEVSSGNKCIYSTTSGESANYNNWAVSFSVTLQAGATGNSPIFSTTAPQLSGAGFMIGYDGNELGVKYGSDSAQWTNGLGTVISLNQKIVLSQTKVTLAAVCTDNKFYIYLVGGDQIAILLNEGGFSLDPAYTTSNTLKVSNRDGGVNGSASGFWTNGAKNPVRDIKVAVPGGVSGISPEDFLQAMGFSTPPSPAVPEPATATLGLLGLSALMLRRRR